VTESLPGIGGRS